MSTFQVGINRQIVGKCDPQKLSYAGAWQNASVAFAELAEHIGQGHPWMPALLNGNRKRWQNNANHAEVLALDIDEGMLIQSSITHPFIRQHCSLGIESASSTEQHNKFRLVFRLPHSVEGWENIRICNRYLGHIVGAADPACKDASRYFFGAPGRKPFLLNESACLPKSFIKEAIAWHEAIETEEKRRAEIAQQQWEQQKAQYSEQDVESLILSALDTIPPDCDYNDWIAIGMALAGMGDQWFHAWDSWSARAKSYKPQDCSSRWPGFRGKKPAPEVIFGIAKRYKWTFPRSERSGHTPAEPIGAAALDATDRQRWQEQEQVQAAQFIDQLAAKKKTRYRTEVKPNPAAEAVRMASKEQDDVHHVANQQEAIRKAAKLGKRVLVNVTMTGGGKNFEDAKLLAGNLSGLGVTKKITVLPDALNPSQDAYTEHYSRLDGRHLGTIVDPLSSKKRRADDETVAAKIEPSNCGFASVRNVDPQLACMVCRHRWHCGQESGDGYGARHQAHEAWRNPNLITSYGRLPHPDSDEAKNLSTAFLTLDEARERVEIAKTIDVPRVQIFEKLQQLVNDAPAIAAQLKPLLDWLLSQEWKNDTGYNPIYGSLLLSLPIIPTDIDWETLIALESTETQKQILTGSADKLTPSERSRLQRLEAKQIPNAENERQWRRLEAKLEQAGKLNRDDRKVLNLYRANYLSQDEEYELANLRERHERTKFKPMSPSELRNKAARLPTPWLVDFLSVAIANQPGLIHFNPDGSFTVTVANDHHRSAIASAKYVMLMGAYEARTNAEIAQRYGCHPNEVFIFDTRPEWQGQPANLKIVQVASLGKMGRQRGQSFEDARLALNAELERRNPGKHLNYDLKGQTRDKTHFVDNSSDNEPFKQGVTSILMTVPRPNMAAKLAEYNVLTGGMANFEDEGFQRFYQGEIQHLIKQTAGRFRSHRQPEKQFTLYIIAEDELPIEVDEVISAAQITPDAAVKTEVTWHLIDQVMASIAIEGGKLTQAAISVGIKAIDPAQRCSQEWISQLFSAIPGGWKLFKAIFQGVFRSGEHPDIKNISTAIDKHSVTYKTEISPEELETIHQLFTSIMELYQQGAISAAEVVKEFVSIALSLGAKTWRTVSASMPLNLRMSIKEMLFQAFPYEWQRKRLQLE